ncbi:MAG: hypothetical protein REI64_11915 [Pedobacter sp.]|uniref:hypothetical protein n=1 Tax=Bacteroidota TaxID=976 RepID=UPI002808C2CE|nr:hypothetical protein [Pedobacter sp.]MDQ8005498.1 hypothetical protein [Pedobacter sp.]
MNNSKLDFLSLYTEKCRKIKKYGVKRPLVEGYYCITELIDVEFHANWLRFMVSADWVPLDVSPDSEDEINIILDLGVLFNNFSDGPKEINPKTLNGAVIKVSEVKLLEGEYEGVTKFSLSAVWTIETLGSTISTKAVDPTIQNAVNTSDHEIAEKFTLEKAANPSFFKAEYDDYKAVEDQQVKKDILNSKPKY